MKRLQLTLLSVALGGAWFACTQCNEPGPLKGDGAVDSSGGDRESGIPDQWDSGNADSNDPLPDAADGWRYLTELGPNCDVQVPLSPSTTLPHPAWTSCVSKNVACEQWDTSAWKGGPQFFRELTFSGDEQWLSVGILAPGWKWVDWIVYQRAGLVPINAWRNGGVMCSVGPIPAYSLLGLLSPRPRYAYAMVTLPAGSSSPSFTYLEAGVPALSSHVAASDSTIALDQQGGGGIARWSVGSGIWSITQQTRLWSPVVVGDDVFAYHEYGNNNWSQLVRVDGDGSVAVMRAVTMRHMEHLRIHGGWMFWTELYGDPNWGNFDQPFAEVWAAPYTKDPSVLAQTAKKLAQVDGVHGSDVAVAFDGFYAISANLSNGGSLFVVRASDGAKQKLDLGVIVGPGTERFQPAFVSATEVWGIAATSVADYFVRLKLQPWP